MYATENLGNSYYFVIKQLIYIVLGLGIAFVFSKFKILYLYRQAYKINAAFALLLTLTLVPGISTVIKGSKRWLNLGFMNLQPGEFLKYTLMLAAIRYFENFNNFEEFY